MAGLTELEIVELLCNGIDPRTGEILDTPRNPEVDQARLNYLKLLRRLDKKGRAADKPTKPVPEGAPNHGKAWSAEDDDELRRLYSDKPIPTLAALSAAFGRREGGIVGRLVFLGLVKDGFEARQNDIKTKGGGADLAPSSADSKD